MNPLSSRHRTGSTQSTKVVAAAAKNRQWVCATGNGTHVDGVMVGMDDYHWVILDLHGVTHLVHKSLATLSVWSIGRPHDLKVSGAEERRLFMAAEGFRSHMLKTVYHHTAEGEGDALSSNTKERTP